MSVSAGEIVEAADRDIGLQVLAGHAGLANRITVARVQKPGLALAGFAEYVQAERVQVLGQAEMAYLKSLPVARRREVLDALTRLPIACLIVTNNLAPPRRLVETCADRRIPLLRTRVTSGVLVSRLTRFLEERLAERTRMHGVLVDVYGMGVLLRGKSGIGKSEAALDLITRGHRLVADDVVEVRKIAPKRLLASTNARLGFHMEVRGLGIINVLDLFGITATRERLPIDLIVHLVDWSSVPNPDRTGLVEGRERILDVDVPMVYVLVRPGRNLATIIEVASRNEILKRRGTFSAQSFQDRVLRDLRVVSPSERFDPPGARPRAKRAEAARGGKKGGKQA
jgi:HPr kinase/phosphorylase